MGRSGIWSKIFIKFIIIINDIALIIISKRMNRYKSFEWRINVDQSSFIIVILNIIT